MHSDKQDQMLQARVVCTLYIKTVRLNDDILEALAEMKAQKIIDDQDAQARQCNT